MALSPEKKDLHAMANKAFFDKWAQTYDKGRISRWFQYTQELTIDLMNGLSPQSRVLDVGCGTGYAVLFLGALLQEGKACGIDISEQMIAKANSKITEDIQDRVEFRQASSDNLPYGSDEFDFAICTSSFHHYLNPIGALNEMKRVLKPGGQVLILDNAVDLSWYTWLWDRILRVFEKGHIRYYRTDELGDMLREAQFENIELSHLKNEAMRYGKLFSSIMVWSAFKPVSWRQAEYAKEGSSRDAQ